MSSDACAPARTSSLRRRAMVWGGNIRLIGRGLGLAIDEITENTTAAHRLLGAIEWLATRKPGIYDGLDVPLHPPLPAEVEAQRWA